MLTAHDFARPTGTTSASGRRHTFGADAERTASALERLAASIRLGSAQGGAIVQGVTITSAAKVEDWTMTTITIELAEQAEG